MKNLIRKNFISNFNLKSIIGSCNNTINKNFIYCQSFNFTGPTETGHKFTTPYMKMRSVKPVYPPPGLDLKVPSDWTHEKFLEKIGGDCMNVSSNFESLNEIFNNSYSEYYKEKGVPVKQRKYILRIINLLRRGLLTFEYIERRQHTAPVRKLTKPKDAKNVVTKKK